MTDAAIYRQGWTLDEVQWACFDRSKVEPWMLAAIKSAALVELNAPDYVAYLKRVFAGADPATIAAIEQWGGEESQHGRALGRWAELGRVLLGAAGLGASGGLAYSLLGKQLRRVPYAGPYLAGVVTALTDKSA